MSSDNKKNLQSQKRKKIVMTNEEIKARAIRNHSLGLIAQAHGFGTGKTPNVAIKVLRKAASKPNNEYAQDILRLCEASVDAPDSGVTGEVRFTQDGDVAFLSDEEYRAYHTEETRRMAEEAAALLNFDSPIPVAETNTVIRHKVG